jgi:hypothetical protein
MFLKKMDYKFTRKKEVMKLFYVKLFIKILKNLYSSLNYGIDFMFCS